MLLNALLLATLHQDALRDSALFIFIFAVLVSLACDLAIWLILQDITVFIQELFSELVRRESLVSLVFRMMQVQLDHAFVFFDDSFILLLFLIDLYCLWICHC